MFVKEEKDDVMVHHLMVFYNIEIDLTSEKKSLPILVGDGINDSDDEFWAELSEINEDNASPLVIKAKQELLNLAELDKVVYTDWKVNK